jgi:hypothetical protein
MVFYTLDVLTGDPLPDSIAVVDRSGPDVAELDSDLLIMIRSGCVNVSCSDGLLWMQI